MLEQGTTIQDLINVFKETGNTSLESIIEGLVAGFENQFDYSFERDYYTSELTIEQLVEDYNNNVTAYNEFIEGSIDYGYKDYMEREF